MHARDLRLLLYFAEVVRQGSIRGAARALSVSPPVVSAALRDLEALVGVTLITRTTRRLTLTDRGRACFDAADRMLSQAGTAMNIAAEDRPVSGVLGISAPIELCAAWLPEILSLYRERYPDVRCSLDASDAQIDLAASTSDIAIRARFAPDRAAAIEMQPDPIACLPLRFVCAPDRRPTRGSFEDRLADVGLIGKKGPEPDTITARHPHGQTIRHTMTPTVSVNNKSVAHKLACQGYGAALLIEDTVRRDLTEGTLVDLDPDVDFGIVTVQALMRDTQPSPAATAFLRVATEASL